MERSPLAETGVERSSANWAGGSRIWLAMPLTSYSQAAQVALIASLTSLMISAAVLPLHWVSVPPEVCGAAAPETTFELLTRPVVPNCERPA